MATGLDSLTPVIEQIHASPTKLVIYVTGGAVHAPTWLLSVPGASRTVLDARVPYSHESLAELVRPGPPRDQATEKPRSVSKEMAELMAGAAFREATNLSAFGSPVVGVGVTCALATDRNRRGEDRAYICTKDSRGETVVTRVDFEKEQLSRVEQDVVASTLTIDAVARACGIRSNIEMPPASHAVTQVVDSPIHASDECQAERQAIRCLLRGDVQTVEFSGGHIYLDAPRRDRLYLPGSFNPLHDGHKEMLDAASKHDPTKLGASFELAVENADKGLLDEDEIARRVTQFTAVGLPLILTRAPLFTSKSELFPRSTFVVGYDTAIRLVQQRYYGSEAEMVRQFATLVQRDCSFLVAGRVDPTSGTYRSMNDVQVPDALQTMEMFAGLDEAAFRNDISSTELRNRASQQ